MTDDTQDLEAEDDGALEPAEPDVHATDQDEDADEPEETVDG